VIPVEIITKAPSAELRPGQTDQDSLPPYELLDEILRRYVEEHEPPQSLVASGLDRAAVERTLSLLHKAEFKRRQAAPGLKMTGRAFGTGWRMPVACRHSLALDSAYPLARAG
jgi:NH3-dependent NAD+ synthetase